MRDWLAGRRRRHPEPLGVIESPDRGRLGVACSGGGVRSAAYNLGALQVLTEQGELRRARYLAAVSGGCYIAGARSIVENQTKDKSLFDPLPPYAAGSPEEQWLRNHSSYLAPGLGGKLRLLLRLLVGAATNFVVIGLFLYAVARPLGWIYQRTLLEHIAWRGPNPLRDFRPWMWMATGAPAGLAALLGWFDVVFRPRHQGVRRALTTWAFRLFLVAFVTFVGLLMLPYLILLLRNGFDELPKWVRDLSPEAHERARVTATPGVPSLAWAMIGTIVLAALRALAAKHRSRLAMVVASIIGPVAIVFVFVWFLNGGTRWTRPYDVAVWGAVLGSFLALYFLSDLTNWSGHPFYRRLLSSAFAVRRTAKQRVEEVPDEDLLPLSATKADHAPELIVCAAANVSTAGVTPPGRAATSFTFSAREVGGPVVGAVPTVVFDKILGERARAMTLPAAMAVSGAAVSPSMGKLTIHSLRFLFALTGIRLGVWLPNPRWAARLGRREKRLGRPRLIYLVKELFGLNSIDAKYLYVTDGGHFENLGLVELLRRGCTEVYLFDASGEKEDTFHALGEAIAIAREDLKVDIDIDPTPLLPEKELEVAGAAAPCGTDHVVGTIRYSDLARTGGILVYAKAVVTSESPYETQAYRQRDPDFPHHPTFDQLFNDEKFEAYWALGRFTAARAVDTMRSTRKRDPAPCPERTSWVERIRDLRAAIAR